MVERETWDDIMHLPDDVALTTSGHHGSELTRLHTLWADWIRVIGFDRDELTDAMCDAADCFQASLFDSLHGFYRSSISNLRSAIDVIAVGTLGKLRPEDDAFKRWIGGSSGSSMNFLNLRSRLSKACARPEERALFKQDGWITLLYENFCRFVHARPGSTDIAFWNSNGPIYAFEGFETAMKLLTMTYAAGYLCCKIARPGLEVPEASKFVFNDDGRVITAAARVSALALGLVRIPPGA